MLYSSDKEIEEKKKNNYKWNKQLIHLISYKNIQTLVLLLIVVLTTIIITTFILLSSTIDKVYSQEQKDTSTKTTTTTNNNNVQTLKYINSRDGYEISYPTGAEIVLDISGLTITDKNKGWEFLVDSGFSSNYKNLEQHVNEIIQEEKDNGYTFLEKKPLSVAGQPAIMINSLYDESDKGKLKNTQIVMHANDMAYEFDVNAPEDKYDQYVSIFFTMLKSFELINVSDNIENIGNTSTNNHNNYDNIDQSQISTTDVPPVVKSSNIIEFSGVNYADVVNSRDINLNSFTVSVWFNTVMDVISENNAILINKGGFGIDRPSFNLNYGIWLNNIEQITGGFEASNGDDIFLISQDSYADGVWHNAILTFDAKQRELKLDIDGNEVATRFPNTGLTPDTTGKQPIRLGANSLAPNGKINGNFTGQLDDIQVWDYAFTNEQVASLFDIESKLER